MIERNSLQELKGKLLSKKKKQVVQ